MKTLFGGLIVLLAAVLVALQARQDPGYVMISYGPWTIESTLVLLLVILAALFAALYFSIRFVLNTWRMPRRIKRWNAHRRAEKFQRATNRGLIALAEGHWAQAEKMLTRYADDSDSALFNYLAAARAAQKLGADNRRDHYLSKAHRVMPDAELAVGLTQAEVQLYHGQLEQALATLMHLRGVAPKHAHVLYLLKRLYERMKSWGDLADLLPELKRRQVLSEADYQKLEMKVHGELLKLALQSGNLTRLKEAWSDIPRPLQRETQLLNAYVHGLTQLGGSADAEPLLREAIQRQWDNEQVLLYGHLDTRNPEQQLRQAEGWVAKHPGNPALLLSLGRLALRCELWGKARGYLEASLGLEDNPEAYQLLGSLLDRLGDHDAAQNCFRKGLEKVSSAKPLPLPAPGHELKAVSGEVEGIKGL